MVVLDLRGRRPFERVNSCLSIPHSCASDCADKHKYGHRCSTPPPPGRLGPWIHATAVKRSLQAACATLITRRSKDPVSPRAGGRAVMLQSCARISSCLGLGGARGSSPHRQQSNAGGARRRSQPGRPPAVQCGPMRRCFPSLVHSSTAAAAGRWPAQRKSSKAHQGWGSGWNAGGEAALTIACECTARPASPTPRPQPASRRSVQCVRSTVQPCNLRHDT